MEILTLHALNRYVQRRIPLNQDILSFLKRKQVEFSEETQEFKFKDLIFVGGLNDVGEPVVLSVYTTTKPQKKAPYIPKRRNRS
jgi:hypothetical protein